jgi:HAD superfamily hydrolase (TIGR01490 family)
MHKLPVVAAFDFDGTISYSDSLFPFLLFTHGYTRSFFNFIICASTLLGYVFRLRTRQETKERILKQFYRGISLSDMQILGQEYVEQGIKVKPEAMERIRWHQQLGHRCVIVSASIDVYLDSWGRKEGFSDVLCSKVAVDSQGKVTGKLIGHNCRGPEKVIRLERLLGPKENYILYAYGDSAGDRQMLQLADYPFYRIFG